MVYGKKSLILLCSFTSVACVSTQTQKVNNLDVSRYIPASSVTFSYTPEPLKSQNKAINSAIYTLAESILSTKGLNLDSEDGKFRYLIDELTTGDGLSFGFYEISGLQVNRVNYKESSELRTWLIKKVKEKAPKTRTIQLSKGTAFEFSNVTGTSKGLYTYVYVDAGSIALSESLKRMEKEKLKGLFGLNLPKENVSEKVNAAIKANGWKRSFVTYGSGDKAYVDYLTNSPNMIQAINEISKKSAENPEGALKLSKSDLDLCFKDIFGLMVLEGQGSSMGTKEFKLSEKQVDIQMESTAIKFKNENFRKFLQLFSGKAPVLSSSQGFVNYAVSINGEKFGAALQGLVSLVETDIKCPPLKNNANKLNMGFLVQNFVKPLKGLSVGIKDLTDADTPSFALGFPLGQGKVPLISMLNNLMKAKGFSIPAEGSVAQVGEKDEKFNIAHGKGGIALGNAKLNSVDFNYLESALSASMEVNDSVVNFFGYSLNPMDESSTKLIDSVKSLKGLKYSMDVYNNNGSIKVNMQLKN